MHTSFCSMSCALSSLNHIEGVPLIDSAKEHLALAVSTAEVYYKTQNSIYWKTATSHTKKRVRKQLHSLAFDTYTEFLEACACINAYVEEVQGTCAPPEWWNRMIISLTLAYDAMLEEHKQEIFSKQLVLFEMNDEEFLA